MHKVVVAAVILVSICLVLVARQRDSLHKENDELKQENAVLREESDGLRKQQLEQAGTRPSVPPWNLDLYPLLDGEWEKVEEWGGTHYAFIHGNQILISVASYHEIPNKFTVENGKIKAEDGH